MGKWWNMLTGKVQGGDKRSLIELKFSASQKPSTCEEIPNRAFELFSKLSGAISSTASGKQRAFTLRYISSRVAANSGRFMNCLRSLLGDAVYCSREGVSRRLAGSSAVNMNVKASLFCCSLAMSSMPLHI